MSCERTIRYRVHLVDGTPIGVSIDGHQPDPNIRAVDGVVYIAGEYDGAGPTNRDIIVCMELYQSREDPWPIPRGWTFEIRDILAPENGGTVTVTEGYQGQTSFKTNEWDQQLRPFLITVKNETTTITHDPKCKVLKSGSEPPANHWQLCGTSTTGARTLAVPGQKDRYYCPATDYDQAGREVGLFPTIGITWRIPASLAVLDDLVTDTLDLLAANDLRAAAGSKLSYDGNELQVSWQRLPAYHLRTQYGGSASYAEQIRFDGERVLLGAATQARQVLRIVPGSPYDNDPRKPRSYHLYPEASQWLLALDLYDLSSPDGPTFLLFATTWQTSGHLNENRFFRFSPQDPNDPAQGYKISFCYDPAYTSQWTCDDSKVRYCSAVSSLPGVVVYGGNLDAAAASIFYLDIVEGT